MNNAIKCKSCGKEFDYEVYGDTYPGCKDREEIECPYCGEINAYEMTSGFVKTFPIKDDEKTNK